MYFFLVNRKQTNLILHYLTVTFSYYCTYYILSLKLLPKSITNFLRALLFQHERNYVVSILIHFILSHTLSTTETVVYQNHKETKTASF